MVREFEKEADHFFQSRSIKRNRLRESETGETICDSNAITLSAGIGRKTHYRLLPILSARPRNIVSSYLREICLREIDNRALPRGRESRTTFRRYEPP